jgi:hypothetical protein
VFFEVKNLFSPKIKIGSLMRGSQGSRWILPGEIAESAPPVAFTKSESVNTGCEFETNLNPLPYTTRISLT